MAFVRKVPTDPAGPLAAAHTRAAETAHSCGRFHSAAEGGRMRGEGRALVPRTDSSVSTSIQWARAPGGGGALESTWPRPMRASRELYGCDLAIAATLFPAARLRGL